MPGFDRRGPMGYGPMTGRGFGPCGSGRGFGRGFQRFAYGAYAYEPTREQEIADLKAEKELLERDLRAVDERIRELEKK